MAKTKPIGVRFDLDLLNATKLTPQKALNIYEKTYTDLLKKEANYTVSDAVFGNDRNNPLINAARGRDISGINEDELKPKKEKPTETKISSDYIPKNLEELRAMCPKELNGFERSDWIGKHRQIYCI